MTNTTINDRIKAFVDYLEISPYEFSKRLGNKRPDGLYKILAGSVEPSPKTLTNITTTFQNLNKLWLHTGEGDMIVNNDPTNVDVKEPFEVEYLENNNSNSFLKLENGQYLMTMPLADYNIQAGFLDHYQDLEFINGLNRHSIIVDKPVKGRYVAFRVKGDSMDSGRADAILQNYIVSTRELQKQHWTSPIRYKDFPYWVIYTTESRYPLLKQIIDHDTQNGVIRCHSLNDGPEYTDFDLSLNDIQALFYVIDISRNITTKEYF